MNEAASACWQQVDASGAGQGRGVAALSLPPFSLLAASSLAHPGDALLLEVHRVGVAQRDVLQEGHSAHQPVLLPVCAGVDSGGVAGGKKAVKGEAA